MEGRAPPPPFSCGGGTPHFCSASDGSTTCTVPSLIPSAIWFGSEGCAAITIGKAAPALRRIKGRKINQYSRVMFISYIILRRHDLNIKLHVCDHHPTWGQKATCRQKVQSGNGVSGYLHRKLQLRHHRIQRTPALRRTSILHLKLVQEENL